MSETTVPWCDDCSRYWNPSTMAPDGTCPECGDQIAEPQDLKAPWHFKLVVAAAGIYLGWRAVQGIVWLVEAL